MAKNVNKINKKPVEAPVVETPAENAGNTSTQILTPSKVKGLTQGEKVAYLTGVQKEREYMMKDSNTPESIINGLTIVAQSTILDIAVGEIACGTSAVGYILTKNDNNYGMLREMGKALGVTLPEFKALPAPTPEQLAEAGLSPDNVENTALVVISKDNVDKKAIEQKKAEKKIEKTEVILDPSKVETEKQLRDTIEHLLVSSKDAPAPRIQKAIDFYQSYLVLQANKAENKKEELDRVMAISRIELLRNIKNLIGNKCPFALNGIAHLLAKEAGKTKSVVPPFCLFYRATTNTSKPGSTIDDAFVADVVKLLIGWSAESQIATSEEIIKENERLIEKFSTDKTKNKNNIVVAETSIRAHKNNIEEANSIIDLINTPSFDLIDRLKEAYTSEDKDSEDYKLSHRIVRNVAETYYKDVDVEKADLESLLHNTRQRAGIINNLFRDSMSRSIGYDEGNLTEVKQKEESVTTEDSKN